MMKISTNEYGNWQINKKLKLFNTTKYILSQIDLFVFTL